MEEVKNIIFDFGGVLVDWNPELLYANVFDDKAEMDYFLTEICPYDWNLKQDEGRPLAVATAEKQAQHPQYAEQIGIYYGRWDEMLGGTIHQNERLVKPLKQKYNLYGLTNWSAETLPIAMARYDFFGELQGIVVSGEEKVVKPNPRIYQILMDRYQIRPQESLFIDDNAANIAAAKALGFQVIHLAEGVDLERELKERGVL